MSRLPAAVFVTLAAVAASACTTTSYCKEPQRYERARSVPPIRAPEGLSIATPATAFRVPAVDGDALTFGYYAPDPERDGEAKLYCLDQPPPLVLAEPPPSAPPAPPAAAPEPAPPAVSP